MIVGMDFGTTNSGMAVYDGGELRFVPLDPANRNPHVARTALYITTDNEVYLGSQATAKYYEQTSIGLLSWTKCGSVKSK